MRRPWFRPPPPHLLRAAPQVWERCWDDVKTCSDRCAKAPARPRPPRRLLSTPAAMARRFGCRLAAQL